jgi:hypothetical protein
LAPDHPVSFSLVVLATSEDASSFSSSTSKGIAAYCDHPVRFGVVESINTTIKAVDGTPSTPSLATIAVAAATAGINA